VTTPPNPPYGNENPYGGQPPEGQSPYGATPYPGGGEYAGQAAPPKTDGVSIPVGVILGIIGISRTKNGQRKGRWAAVTGLILGVLGIVAWIGLFAGGYWIFSNVVTPENAEVGQCVDIEEDDGSVSMLKKDCSEDHDAEIVGVEELDGDAAQAAEEQQVAYCSEVMSEEDFATVTGREDLELQAVFEDPNNVEDGDHIVCYAEATSGKLDEKVLE
jgi:hypothetical protein